RVLRHRTLPYRTGTFVPGTRDRRPAIVPTVTKQPPAPRPSPRRLALAALINLLVPGLGHLLIGRRRGAVLFFAPIALMLAVLLGLFASGGFTAILAFVV